MTQVARLCASPALLDCACSIRGAKSSRSVHVLLSLFSRHFNRMLVNSSAHDLLAPLGICRSIGRVRLRSLSCSTGVSVVFMPMGWTGSGGFGCRTFLACWSLHGFMSRCLLRVYSVEQTLPHKSQQNPWVGTPTFCEAMPRLNSEACRLRFLYRPSPATNSQVGDGGKAWR